MVCFLCPGLPSSGSGIKHIRRWDHSLKSNRLLESVIVLCTPGYKASDLSTAPRRILGPVSSKHLRRFCVFKMSQDMFKTKLMFHQTLEIKEVLTFCPIRRTNKSLSQPILLA